MINLTHMLVEIYYPHMNNRIDSIIVKSYSQQSTKKCRIYQLRKNLYLCISILLYKASKNLRVHFLSWYFLLYPFYPLIRRIIFIFG
jgi:hypothetical protein